MFTCKTSFSTQFSSVLEKCDLEIQTDGWTDTHDGYCMPEAPPTRDNERCSYYGDATKKPKFEKLPESKADCG